jgi:hypothetical protein
MNHISKCVLDYLCARMEIGRGLENVLRDVAHAIEGSDGSQKVTFVCIVMDQDSKL